MINMSSRRVVTGTGTGTVRPCQMLSSSSWSFTSSNSSDTVMTNIQRNKRVTLNGFSLVTLPRDKGHLQCSHAQQKNLKNESYSSYYNSSSNTQPCLFLSLLAIFDFALHYVIKPV